MTRVEAILANPAYTAYVAQNAGKEAARKFCRHGFQHLVDVARITYILMLENGDIAEFMDQNNLNRRMARELIYAAGLLHDIGRWKEYETGEDHAAVSAELAVDILAAAGFSGAESALITSAIAEHRRRNESMSFLGRYLFEADKLSRVCFRCEAAGECYKFEEMKALHKGLIY